MRVSAHSTPNKVDCGTFSYSIMLAIFYTRALKQLVEFSTATHNHLDKFTLASSRTIAQLESRFDLKRLGVATLCIAFTMNSNEPPAQHLIPTRRNQLRTGSGGPYCVTPEHQESRVAWVGNSFLYEQPASDFERLTGSINPAARSDTLC